MSINGSVTVRAFENCSPNSSQDDCVNRPPHYVGLGGLEARTVIEDAGLSSGFYLGNAIKYALRAGRKTADALVDLRKAQRNLQMLIETEEEHERPLTDNGKRRVKTGRIAQEFGLSERLALVVSLLTMTALTVHDVRLAHALLQEEIDGRSAAAIWPVPHRESA